MTTQEKEDILKRLASLVIDHTELIIRIRRYVPNDDIIIPNVAYLTDTLTYNTTMIRHALIAVQKIEPN